MYFVYILYSKKLNRYYIGTTDNISRRLEEYNSAFHEDSFTVKGIPWTLFLTIDNLSSNQAYLIEQNIKKMKSKIYLQNLLKFPELVEKLKIKFI